MGCTIIELLTGKPPYFDLPQVCGKYFNENECQRVSSLGLFGATKRLYASWYLDPYFRYEV